jgi:hypothetical protein
MYFLRIGHTPCPHFSLEESVMQKKKRAAYVAAVGAVLAGVSGSALAVDNVWTGATSTDWNDPTNWSLGRVPTRDVPNPGDFDDAVININAPNIATITANLASIPRDIVVATAPGATGQLNHSAGTAATGPGNWMFVGRNGGTGTYNLTGTGTMNVGDRLYIAGHNGAAATGTVNVNSATATLTTAGDLNMGAAGGTGTLNLDAGTVNVGAWISIGRDENGLGGTGNVNQTGGSLNVSGNTVVALPGTTGNLLQTGGTHTIANGELWVGQGVNVNPGVGTATVNGGTLTISNNWLAVGREGGRGTLNVGGTGIVQKLGGGHITIGTGNGGNGTVNVSGNGLLSTNADFIVAENNPAAVGLVNQTGGTVQVGGNLEVQRNGTGTYNLSGGILSVNGNIDGVDGTFTFTGGRITRSNAGVITYNGNLAVGAQTAGFNLGTDKTFDVNGVLSILSGVTFDVTGVTLPAQDLSVQTGGVHLGDVNTLVGTFGPLITDLPNLINTPGATHITEAQGEGGLFDANTQSVFWVQENAGSIDLRYSIAPVPEPGALSFIAIGGVTLLRRRRR